MTPTSYCWSCGSLRVVLKLWLQQIHFRNDFNLDSHRCKQDTTFRTKVTCTKRLRSFRMHRRFQLVVFMLVWCFLSVVWFIYTVHCTFRRPSSHTTFSVADSFTLTHFCTYLCSICTYTLFHWKFTWSTWSLELCDFQGVALCDAAAAFVSTMERLCRGVLSTRELWHVIAEWILLETSNRNHFNVKCGELFQRGTLTAFFTG